MIATGAGTGGSSSIPAGGARCRGAATKLADNLKELAADALEASPGDLEIADGAVRVAGTDRAISFAGSRQPRRTRPTTSSPPHDTFTPTAPTYPNGTHLAEVEIDPATGATRIVNYVVVDDFGVTLNPLLLAGQVHGGAVQGIGQALMEDTVYDAESGQLVTASLMDYALPRASDMPDVRVRDPQRAVQDQPARRQGRGRGGRDRLLPGGDERDRSMRCGAPTASATSTCRRRPQRVWAAIEEGKRQLRL